MCGFMVNPKIMFVVISLVIVTSIIESIVYCDFHNRVIKVIRMSAIYVVEKVVYRCLWSM